MKLTKKQEAEILKAYNEYWGAYLKGDMRTMAYWMHENIQMIGSGRGEVFENKKKTIKYYKSTANQVAGKADMRNRQISVLPVGDQILVNEECDFFVLMDSTWTFYGEGRISTLFTRTNKGWKIIQEHGSMPDARTSRGEQVNTDKIKAENIKLRDAVKRRTVDLEEKNRELEIETSLERVRAVAMGMKNPADMLKICKTISQQLQKLGLKEIRNIQTAIFYEDRGTYMNYQYYARHNKTFITDTIYTDHKVSRDFAAQMLKGKGKFYITHIKGRKKLKDWIAYQKKTNVFIDKYLYTAPSLSYYWYSLGPVALGISTYFPLTEEEENLFKRFLNVFELSYRRYLDIEKAGVQAREAEIELALERVRARTMGMQKSEELGETSFLLFQQFKGLGETSDQISIGIFKEDENIMELYSTLYGSQWKEAAKVDLGEPVVMRKIHTAWKKQKKSLVIDLAGNDLRKYNTYRKKLSNINYKEKRWVIRIAFFSKGVLTFSAAEPQPQETIQLLERFAGVFDGTYTRFLDLQKAEAQTREAKVEAALERVRARGMAMQSSEELGALIGTLFTELTKLHLVLTRCVIWIIDQKTNDAVWWMANSEDPSHPMSYFIPYHRQPPWLAFMKEWKKRTLKWVYDLKGKTKKNWDDHLFTKTGLSKMPKFIRDGMKAPERVLLSASFNNFGGMNVASLEPLSDEHFNILLRFAKVFDQTYTRFLDLQKAESQAREAEIELALERVRAKTMAMQKSEELKETTLVLFQQFKSLGATTAQVSICIFDEQTKMGEMFVTLKGEKIDRSFQMELDKEVFVMKKARKAFLGKQKSYSQTIKGKELQTYNHWRNTLIGKKGWDESAASRKQAWHVNAVFFSRGMMGISSETSPSDEALKLLERFGNVFDLTFTRFLDLQKAEAQAREAKIEAALERVRARTMAMQHSNELAETASLLFKQVSDLGIETWTSGFNIWEKNGTSFIGYNPTPTGGITAPYHIPSTEDRFFLKIYDTKKRGEDFLVFDWQDEPLAETYRYMKTLPVVKDVLKSIEDAGFQLPTFQINHCTFFSHGFLLFITLKPYPGTHDIFKRFGKVFEQTYTRFLDLQKAEAQAREAEIELALERVRSRTMAMHQTSELQEVIHTVHKELLNLNLSIYGGSFVVINDDVGPELRCWGSGGTANTSEEVQVPHFNMPFCTNLIKSIKSRPGFFTEEFSQKEKKKYFTKLFEHKPWSDLSSNQKKETLSSLGGYTRSVAVSKHTSIFIINHNGRKFTESENDILKRFAKVFEQTYTRFLDLQKAEAQAREAQIELGLERVRARAMAMQKSDELKELIVTVSGELSKLDIILDRCFIITYDIQTMGSTWWMSNPEIPTEPIGLFVKYHEHLPYLDHINAWKERKVKWQYILEGEVKKKWDKFLFVETELSQLPDFVIANMRSKEKVYLSSSFNSFGYLTLATLEPLSDEQFDIMLRFAKVFDLTYTRFNDLKQAEAQVRESQIQLALERVRARSLAMHHTSELQEVVNVAAQQLLNINIDINGGVFIIINNEVAEDIPFWASSGAAEYIQKVVLPFRNIPIISRLRDAIRSGNDFFVEEYSREEKTEFFEHLFRYSPWNLVPPKRKKELLGREGGLTRSVTIAQHTSIGITNHFGKKFSDNDNAVLKRFSNVLEQSYTRFLDLQKAEAQVRESQIQLALERVRARTMAMQRSEDMLEAASLLFRQIEDLGTASWSSGFIIFQPEDLTINSWMSKPDGSMGVPFNIPLTEDPFFIKIYEAYKKREEFFVMESGGKDLEETYRYMFSLPGASKALGAIEDIGFQMPTFQITHCAFFPQGFLMFITYEPCPEMWDIFKRFGKVFEQTYTRFLDLQKAEAQAREAKIEAALEKVRSRSMGMQKSEELKEVIQVVYDQFVHLNIHVEHTGFIMDYNTRDDMHIWLADKHEVPSEVTIPYFDSAHWNSFNEAKEKGIDFFATQLSFEEKNKFYQDLFKLIPGVPEETLEYYFSCPGLAGSTVLLDNVSLYIENFDGIPYTDEENNTLMRFGKVFQQTYTRFLDLQKAEAQSRENQIQLALERGRTQSMIMQHSSELDDTLRVFHEQVLLLGIKSAFSFLWLPDEDKDRHIFWAAWAENISIDPLEKKGSAVFKSKAINYPLDRNEPATAQCLIDWKGKEPVVSYHVPPAGVESYFAAWHELIAGVEQLEPEYFSDGLYYVEAFIKYGCFGVMVKSEMPEEEKKILYRFAIEFERAYTRFLDLQKAEGQVREARIEAALEKVRSRTMAMQKSNELADVASVLFKELNQLVNNLWTCGFVLCEKDRAEDEWWLCAEGGFIPAFYLPNVGDVSHYNIYRGWLNGETYHTEQLEGKALNEHYDWLMNIEVSRKIFEEMAAAGFKRPDWQKLHCAYFSKGYLCIITREPCPEEEVFKRFAQVFDLTYTRFLDLQKAEAQAREAKIEAALERVRSRTMGMQKSNELGDVAVLLYQQFLSLGVSSVLNCGYVEINEINNIQQGWMTKTDGSPSESFNLPMIGDPVFQDRYDSWKRKDSVFHQVVTSDQLKKHIEFTRTKLGSKEVEDLVVTKFPDPTIFYCGNFSNGYLHIITGTLLSKPEENLLERFTRVFEQTYTRFLDLQKAEAQAREAQIEASLERVRAKTMAMHSSDEVSSATATMFTELEKLGIENFRGGISSFKNDLTQEVWSVNNLVEGKTVKAVGIFDMNAHPFWQAMYAEWKQKKDFFYYYLSGKEKEDYVKLLNASPNYLSQPIKEFPDIHFQIYYFNEGAVWANSLQPHTEEDKQIMKRFASVFSLTFRRYQDLKKAEAQAREAQVEASLERVRSKTMAMHNSQDVADTVSTLFDELMKLGIDTYRCGIGIMDESKPMEVWTARAVENGKMDLIIGLLDMNIHPLFQGALKGWKNKKESFSYELKGDDLIRYYDILNQQPDYPVKYDLSSLPDQLFHNDFYFQEGTLFIFSLNPLPAEPSKILKRFAAVFGQTYRRYLDLLKAEAQAREATIEAALEKVRGKAMAMHNSNDLSNTASMVFSELRKLGINPIRSGVGIFNKQSRSLQFYSAAQSANGDSLSMTGGVNISSHQIFEKQYESWLKNENYFTVLKGEELRSYYKVLSESYIQSDFKSKKQQEEYGHWLMFSEGFLFAWSEAPYNDTEIKILKRFATIIDLTFRRYIELQKSEANTREAVKQAALDRIRADIASMRTIFDLNRITPLIWNELTILGIPFIRCGVFIMDDSQQLIHTFLSTPEGKAIAAFHLPYDTPGNISLVLSHWRKKEKYLDHWDEAVFTEFAHTLVKQGALASPDQYLATLPQGGFYLHFLPFLQGMLYVGNTTQLNEEEIDLLQSVADAFATAYARYEDFNKLEAAKKQVDSTLSELQVTQKQLIQSEKMASLGELTAGIAHEIQNPLNFVNNFSEVSNELIDEMNAEIEKGDMEEAKAISNDIKQNLEKINHHGKRADAIVKGMLQHSRSSSGVKEPTDINALADEYLRLAYHGLRAKDKSFNATMKTEFDEALEKINVIPQDMGRVILNLITNAFYVVNEKKKQGIDGYEPTVTVKTRKPPLGGLGVCISVADNGNGISQKVLDKIFHPFFTTKPTGQGTGLGLSLSYDIVKAHGGEIKVETQENKGTEFIIQLPMI